MTTIKIKKPEAPTVPIAPAVPAPAAESANINPKQEGIFVSSRYANPLEGNGKPVSTEKWTWAAILSILAFLLFVVLVVIEYLDYTVLIHT
ncbi:MAG: hypothetical protein ACI4QT_10385 [Kiritimatiellia bacterium]